MKCLIVIAMLLTSANAFACDLSLVAPAKSVLKKPVQVKAVLADDMLTVSYAVTAPLNARKVLGPQKHPYDFDVVELFVTFSETGFPYFEFEVSPFNQPFQVRIVSLALHQGGCRFGHGVFGDTFAARLERGIENSPKTSGMGRRSQKNPRKFLFHSGTCAKTQFLELIPAQGQNGGLPSAEVFPTVASM
jgi:hypothetical protein